MNYIYHFPEKATFNKVIPKNTIYSYAKPSSKVKELFIRQVEKITWAYKLSPQTINLPADGYVTEIQVIVVDLKNNNFNQEILKTIDKAIPSPLIFVLRVANKICYAMAYKRQSEADQSKWVISEYFYSPWMNENQQKKPLPVALNLRILYEILIKNLSPVSPLPDEEMETFINRVEELNIKQREAEKLQNKIRREKQFNRKVELNNNLKKIRSEIKVLTTGQSE
jgi:hypothetical protein